VSHEGAATRKAETRDGRTLTYSVSGDRSGWPVFLLHGTPGSRFGPKPRGSVLYRAGVRLISYDRPGYGGSDRLEHRTVADAAADVEAVADHLGVTRFSVIGRSGGGPHALACAALLSGRVSRTAVLVSVAPANASGLDWFRGMTVDNVECYGTLDLDRLAERIRRRAERTFHDPETLLSLIRKQMPMPDRRFTNDVTIQRLLTDTYEEATRNGPYGWIDDALALRRDWGFRLEGITGPVLLWHGAEDNFSPASHSVWLASRIPGAKVRVQPGSAHFGAMERLPEVLTWVTPAGTNRRAGRSETAARSETAGPVGAPDRSAETADAAPSICFG
jgi:pimeloyl-ACP methyl ester carboxylesterase